MAGSDAVSALGRLAGVTVDQVKSCSKLGTLLEATVCSQQVDSMAIEVISQCRLTHLKNIINPIEQINFNDNT